MKYVHGFNSYVKTYKTVSTNLLPNFGSVFFRTILLVFQHDYKYRKRQCWSTVQNIHYNISLTELLKAVGSKLQSVLQVQNMGEVGKTG